MKKAFTLIELLIVIGIMAVIAAGVVALIDPVEKTRQANDANTQNAIGQTATALQSYAAQQPDGMYPAVAVGLQPLIDTGELKVLPAYSDGNNATYASDASGTIIYHQLYSKKYVDVQCSGADAYWFWRAENGRACGSCGVPTTATACGTW